MFAKSKSVVITGACRDSAAYLSRSLPNIKALGEAFKEWHGVFFENDSKDGTRQILEQFAAENPSVTIRTPTYKSDAPPDYIQAYSSERLALIRQEALDYIRAHHVDTDYVLVVDMDNVTSGNVDVQGMTRNLEMDNWSFQAPLMQPYYDVFALRAQGLYKHNPFDLARHLGLDFSLVMNKHNAFKEKLLEDSKHFLLHAVDSAFCGMCIYRTKYFVQSTYLPTTTGCPSFGEPCSMRTDCEHVGFHLRMREACGVPGFINLQWKPTYV